MAVEAELRGTGPVRLRLGDDTLSVSAVHAEGACLLEVTTTVGTPASPAPRTSRHRSRRSARAEGLRRMALTLTGTEAVVLGDDGSGWRAHGRIDLREVGDRGRAAGLCRDETWLAGLEVEHTGDVARLRAGGYGQLGLRDLRLLTHADGTAYADGPGEEGRVLWLSATSAGPGFFGTAHTSVWRLELDGYRLEHRADLFFRRPGRPGVFGDHATHVVRDGGSWLVATSTWGDFDHRRDDAGVEVTLARTDADLLHGRHVLDTEPLPLPVDPLASVGVWDPHLVRTDLGQGPVWLVGYVSAREFFDFHPVLAEGPALDRLSLRAALTSRRATEGTTLVRWDGRWRVLASDGRDNPRRHRAQYPVLDLDLRPDGAPLDAAYPTNIPWPTLAPLPDGGWLLLTFNGRGVGGRVVGYGSHGDVVVLRAPAAAPGAGAEDTAADPAS
ncbi:hypothetical protein JOE61_002509 [Nocardioides salarius]|uniref:Uncharacterized protein n=1 Tax=Nocardioides salarius TaxID=374513 RepID=A0ABS2MC16_9ACTN|nr:hypothetical protein [Nocardioides salarius]MBM7508695.1 hypothetical protein [Nocardioides salarius]